MSYTVARSISRCSTHAHAHPDTADEYSDDVAVEQLFQEAGLIAPRFIPKPTVVLRTRIDTLGERKVETRVNDMYTALAIQLIRTLP